MDEPASDAAYATKNLFGYDQVAYEWAAYSQLPAAIGSPGPYRAVGLQCQIVAVPCIYGEYAGKSGYLHRREPIRRGSISQLSIVVISPGPYRAVRLHRQAVLGACSDTH